MNQFVLSRRPAQVHCAPEELPTHVHPACTTTTEGSQVPIYMYSLCNEAMQVTYGSDAQRCSCTPAPTPPPALPANRSRKQHA